MYDAKKLEVSHWPAKKTLQPEKMMMTTVAIRPNQAV